MLGKPFQQSNINNEYCLRNGNFGQKELYSKMYCILRNLSFLLKDISIWLEVSISIFKILCFFPYVQWNSRGGEISAKLIGWIFHHIHTNSSLTNAALLFALKLPRYWPPSPSSSLLPWFSSAWWFFLVNSFDILTADLD